MVQIKGWQKNTLIDYPPYTSSTVFLGNCNFRCGYCHNPELVVNHHLIPNISEKEILDYLKAKKQWIDAVCITGGEPTMHKDLPDFIKKLKEIGLLVKLDTNGSNPEMLKNLIEQMLIDSVSMDIKANLENYEKVVELKVNKENIEKSIELIKNSGIDYEFRTTVIPGLVGKKELFLIGKWLKGSKKFSIQNFRNRMPTIKKEMQEIAPYSKEELKELAELVKPFFDKVEIKD